MTCSLHLQLDQLTSGGQPVNKLLSFLFHTDTSASLNFQGHINNRKYVFWCFINPLYDFDSSNVQTSNRFHHFPFSISFENWVSPIDIQVMISDQADLLVGLTVDEWQTLGCLHQKSTSHRDQIRINIVVSVLVGYILKRIKCDPGVTYFRQLCKNQFEW